MFSPLLILAQVAEHAAEVPGEAASGITKITQDFGIDVPMIVAQIVSFSVVALFLYYFAFKPVLATMGERTKKIEAGLKFADDMKAQLAAAQQESAALIKNAQLEANKVIEDSRKTAKDLSERAQVEATDRANQIIVKAQQAIDLEHKKMLADARTEIARLVVVTTERVLAKKLSEADRAGYNEVAARELTSV